MMSQILINTKSANDLKSDSTKPLPYPMEFLYEYIILKNTYENIFGSEPS